MQFIFIYRWVLEVPIKVILLFRLTGKFSIHFLTYFLSHTPIPYLLPTFPYKHLQPSFSNLLQILPWSLKIVIRLQPFTSQTTKNFEGYLTMQCSQSVLSKITSFSLSSRLPLTSQISCKKGRQSVIDNTVPILPRHSDIGFVIGTSSR